MISFAALEKAVIPIYDLNREALYTKLSDRVYDILELVLGLNPYNARMYKVNVTDSIVLTLIRGIKRRSFSIPTIENGKFDVFVFVDSFRDDDISLDDVIINLVNLIAFIADNSGMKEVSNGGLTLSSFAIKAAPEIIANKVAQRLGMILSSSEIHFKTSDEVKKCIFDHTIEELLELGVLYVAENGIAD